MPRGRLFLIPCPIAEGGLPALPAETIAHLHRIRHFIVERARTARRYISSTQPPHAISSLAIIEMDKHQDHLYTTEMMAWLDEGHDVGIISESGCPGVADPGARYVAHAQDANIQVLPLVGPSSILLSLMASGLDGQNFAFIGYLPAKTEALKQRIRQIDAHVAKTAQTQIFIETPYRNDKMLAALLSGLAPSHRLCIAQDIGGSQSSIQTKSIVQWRKLKPSIGKINCIFLIGR